MTRIYVAGPMSGLPRYNLPAFQDATRTLSERGFSVLSPVVVVGEWGLEQTWRWYRREAIHQLATADCVALLPGWQWSRGACLERETAIGLALPALDLQEWIELGPEGLRLVVDQMGGGNRIPDFEAERAAALALKETK